MKKLLLLFIPLLFFIGCEEEDNNDDNSNNSTTCLEGSWSIQSFDSSLYDDYVQCFCDYVSGACDVFDEDCFDFVFESDNYFHSLVNGEFGNGGTYQADCPIGPGSTIIVEMNDGYLSDGTWEMEVQSISSTTMIVDLNLEVSDEYGDYYYYDYGGILTFSKVD
jgi:hypothetical protein